MSSQNGPTDDKGRAGPGSPRNVTGRSRAGPGADRGSATVLAIGVIGGLTALLVAALALVSVLVTGQQARTAADLAALAAAGQVVLGAGREQACAEAAAVAGRNGVRLQSCALEPHDGQPWPRVLVSVQRDVASTPWSLTAREAPCRRPRALEPMGGSASVLT